MAWLLENKDLLISAVTAVVTCAAALAALTKGDRDDTLVGKARKLVDLLALNFGGAKNKNAQDK